MLDGVNADQASWETGSGRFLVSAGEWLPLTLTHPPLQISHTDCPLLKLWMLNKLTFIKGRAHEEKLS